MTTYKVLGQRKYRHHKPGEVFDAKLDRGAEFRALLRGDIEVVDRAAPALIPGSFMLPEGWIATNERTQDG